VYARIALFLVHLHHGVREVVLQDGHLHSAEPTLLFFCYLGSQYMMEVQKAMVNATLGGPSCCSGGSCSAGVHSVTPNAPPTQAPPGSGNMDMQR
jgi:hypothetical protein